jgi:carboxypeptidase Q
MTWLALCLATALQVPDPALERIRIEGMGHPQAFGLLKELTKGIGHRLSGSPEAAKAVVWGERRMRELGFQNVHLVPCKVPHWVRGKAEKATLLSGARHESLAVCALGGSIATPKGGIEAPVIAVNSLAEATALGDRAKGKIVFFNRRFDPTLLNTFAAYGGAVDQRSRGASTAARVGAVAVLVRSMSTADDDKPHTGAMNYSSDAPKIPAAALSTLAANRLEDALTKNSSVNVRLEMNCETLPEVDSASVVGELTGSEFPRQVVVMGGHLDSWDLGEGAHDDGAGVTQSLEALSILKRLGLRPKRTIRVVLFMNEENGGAGGRAYAASRGEEKAFAAIESDSGGFAPRAFGVTGTADQIAEIQAFLPSLRSVGIERIGAGGGGSDIGPLGPLGAILIGLEPESQRYFDYHHSWNDTLDRVNPRELQLGAVAMSMLAWQLSEAIPG